MGMTTAKIALHPAARATCVALLAAATVLVALTTGGEGQVWVVVGVAVSAAVAAVVLCAASHWIEVDAGAVTLRYRPFLRRQIATRDVLRWEIAERTRPAAYGGYGLRLRGRHVLAFVNRAGPSVRIEPRSGRTCVVVLASADEARALAQVLDRVVPATRPVE